MIEGFLTLDKICNKKGDILLGYDALNFGIMDTSKIVTDHDFKIESHELPLGYNNFTDNGRQLQAYLFGNRSPLSDFVCAQFGTGTGTAPASTVDTDLSSPINFYLGGPLKPIDSISYPAPFVAKVSFTLASDEANGYLLTEFGLYSGNGVLYAKKTNTGLNKTSDWSPTLSWRIRF